MQIEVRPIQVEKWHKKKGKDSFTRPKRVQALVNPQTMQYRVVFTDAEKKKLEKELKLDFNPLFTNNPHPVYDTEIGIVILEDIPTFFNTDNLYDLIKVGILKGSNAVANSMAEYEKGLWSNATHVIFNEQEEVEIKANKLSIKNKVIRDCFELTKERKVQLVTVLSNKVMRGQSEGVIDVELDKLIQKDPLMVSRYISLDKETVQITSLVFEALKKGSLVKDGLNIRRFDDIIGTSVEEVVEYLKKDTNQVFKLKLMEETTI